MRKLPIWLLALALTAVGAAGTIGYGYQKANDEGINGEINIITSQAIGVEKIDFVGFEDDDSGIAVTAEDGLSYIIGLQLNNGDEYQDNSQYIKITLKSYAKFPMVVMLTTEFSITEPDQADSPCDDIHIWYCEKKGDTDIVGQIDPWTYLIWIDGTEHYGASPALQTFAMCVDVGQMVVPGFYQFTTYIEPTNWEGFETTNMNIPDP